MKTIVINALSALEGGGQTYLVNILNNFVSKNDLRLVVIVNYKHKSVFINNNSLIKIIAPCLPSKNIFYRLLWEIFTLPRLIRKLQANVLYYPGGIVLAHKTNKCKIAIAFQNMLPFAFDEIKRYSFGYMQIRLWLLRISYIHAFKKADLIIFISEYAKDIIDRAVPYRKGKNTVIPHGIPSMFYRYDKQTIAPLPYEYILYVSYVDVYKNQVEVIKAWEILKKKRYSREKLVFIGPASPSYLQTMEKIIKNAALENDIVYLGKVQYSDLPVYYQFAKINIFASNCENCPNILLEAMAAGKALFCSNRMPMPEFASDAVVYFNPNKPDELADLFIKYIDDAAFLNTMGRSAYERSLAFDLRLSSQKTWDELLKLTE